MIRPLLHRAILLTLAFLLISPMAMAQPQADDVLSNTSEEELREVAEVLNQIEDVRQKYKKKIRQASKQKKIISYQRKMTIEIDRAIEQHDGMTIDRYEEITRAAQSNYELKQKILTFSKKNQGSNPDKAKSR